MVRPIFAASDVNLSGLDPAMRVLIVEGDLELAVRMGFSLTMVGHEVVSIAVSTRRAIASAGETLPDLALVDLDSDLGDGSGIEAAESLGEMGIKLLLVSESCVGAKAREMALGCLTKPVQPADVALAVRVCERLLSDGAFRWDEIPRNMRVF